MVGARAVVIAFLSAASVAPQQSPEWVDRDGWLPIGVAVHDSPLPLRVIRASPWRTMEFDGSSFRRVTEAGSHPTDPLAHAVHDPVEGRTVVYEANVIGTGPFIAAVLHCFDGVRWTHAQTTHARVGAAMAFDPASGRMILFGGEGLGVVGNELFGDTAALVGTSWGNVASTGPSPRKDAAMARTANGLVLFGGRTTQFLGDTWSWNGTSWSLVTSFGPPGPRAKHVMSFDPVTGDTLLYGGIAGTTVLGDTWRWNGAAWSLVASPAGAPLVEPQLANADGRTWLIGREAGTANVYRVEEWDGVGWHLRWRRELPADRADPAAYAFDEIRSELVLFGGYALPSPYAILGDTWTYGQQWVRRTGVFVPPPRAHAGMAFDRLRGNTVMFGGAGAAWFGDTWLWDGSAWSQAQPSSAPSPRQRPALAFHPGRGTVFLHGGTAPGNLPLDDTWEWDGTGWSPVAVSPLASRRPHLAYDEARGVLVLYQEHGSGSPPTATHAEFVNNTWVSVGSAPFGRFAYDPEIGAVTVHSTGLHWSFVGGQWTNTPAQEGVLFLATDRVHGEVVGAGTFDRMSEVERLSTVAARAVPRGAGCGPARPVVLGCNSRPALGAAPRLDVACAASGAAAWLFLGVQATSVPIGGGCTVHVDAIVHVAGALAGNGGWAHFATAVPFAPALIGVTLHAQAVVASPAGLGFSNALDLRIGK